MKLSEIYKILGLEFSGEELEITALNSLSNAGASELGYCDSEKNAKFIEGSKAGAILVASNLKELVGAQSRAVVVENPHLAFAILSEYFAKELLASQPQPAQISPSAKIMPNVYVGSGAVIGDNTLVMAGAYVGDNVKIGANCVIHPNVVIYNDTVIGNGCRINEHVKIYHNGNVVLEDFVEIGACTTIDRGVFESTVVKAHVKIDNLVQVGHNCEIGYGSILVSQVGLAGSTKLGRNVVMGGQSGSAGHLKVGDFAQIAARGGVSKDIAGGKKYAGAYPIMELADFFKLQAKIARFFKKN